MTCRKILSLTFFFFSGLPLATSIADLLAGCNCWCAWVEVALGGIITRHLSHETSANMTAKVMCPQLVFQYIA